MCPRCLEVADEEDASCARCGEELLNQLVVFVDGPAGGPRHSWSDIAATTDQNTAPPQAGLRWAVLRGDPRCGPPYRFPVTDGRGGPQPPVSTTMVVSRVIDLTGPASEEALHGWWTAHGPRATVDAGPDHLRLGQPIHDPGDGCLCHVATRLSGRSRWRAERLDLELLAWSADTSELTLRPLRYRPNRSTHYFRAAYALLDRIAVEVMDVALHS